MKPGQEVLIVRILTDICQQNVQFTQLYPSLWNLSHTKNHIPKYWVSEINLFGIHPIFKIIT